MTTDGPMTTEETIPLATYRVQLNPRFGFQQVGDLAGYLAELGISHVYASPIFRARHGSPHGYDVVDPTVINPELGGRQGFDEAIRRLKRYRLGWIQDLVPNHMAYDCANHMLMDVLEHGRWSRYFNLFDIEWDHPYQHMKGKLLAPFLGASYQRCLENKEIQVSYEEGQLLVHYANLKFPLRLETSVQVFSRDLAELTRRLGRYHPDRVKLLGSMYVLNDLPREDVQERYDQSQFAKTILWELYTRNPTVREFVDRNLSALNGRPGDPESFDSLDGLLGEQLFRLCFWKVATEEINYRRFVTINDLIGVRVQEQEVFDYTHSLLFELLAQDQVSGLRIDHVDGLYDPSQYLNRLRARVGDKLIVVEKVLGETEPLPHFWPVEGTTGYDFLNYVNGVFCRRQHETAFTRAYEGFSRNRAGYQDLLLQKKRMMMDKSMTGDLDNLTRLLQTVSGRFRWGADLTFAGLRRTLVELVVHLPVYRTYLSPDCSRDEDGDYMAIALEKATKAAPDLLHELEVAKRFLLFEGWDEVGPEEQVAWSDFVMRFQQLTGAAMAKGMEDTTLYVYNRLLSLNEVGSSPHRFGIPVEEFHSFQRQRGMSHPHSLNATATHDTKRGEDVRARLNVLSELPREWRRNLRTWNRMNSGKKHLVNGLEIPDRNDEYFLYQTLLGTFPFEGAADEGFVKRIQEYVVKAVREAKVHTTWLKPDTAYEEGFTRFAAQILDRSPENEFLPVFRAFAKKIAWYGAFNSLAQVLLKITCPGIPDFYQGTELWDLSLVDPDNRRPVDFETRRRLLDRITRDEGGADGPCLDELISRLEDGGIKLFLARRALEARAKNRTLFQEGSYLPLTVEGAGSSRVIAFAREYQNQWAVVAVARFLADLVAEGTLPVGPEIWTDTRIPLPSAAPSHWKRALTGEHLTTGGALSVGHAFARLPLAFLVHHKEER